MEENLIREFIAEAEEYLFLLEPNLLRLEKEPHNTTLIEEIFLATHSIKGTASYVGLSYISSFTHSLESLLDRIRKKKLQVTPQLVDSLLQGLDTLKLLIHHVSLGKPPEDCHLAIDAWRLTLDDLKLDETPSDNQQTPIENQKSKIENPAEPWEMTLFSRNLSFDIQACEIDPEDAEIFADIANQQIEFMQLALDKICETLQEDRDSSLRQAQDIAHKQTSLLINGFRKIQSSAVLLNANALDAMLMKHALFFDELENQRHHLSEHDIGHIAGIIGNLERMVAAISEYSQQEPVSALQQKGQQDPFSQSFSLTSPALDMSPTLRVNAERVDSLLNLVGELVINRARLVQINQEMKAIYEDLRTGEAELHAASPRKKKKNIKIFKRLKERFDEIILELERVTNQMQEGTMSIRMVPLSQVVGRFPRMIRDLSRQSGKDVAIRIFGAETELDKTVVDILGDPLIHIIRNAVDHGIEEPAERLKQGKLAQGMITLSAYHEGSQVIIEVEDDGRGIDGQRVKQKALQQGIIHVKEADSLQERELAHLIFHSGFSTVETVSSLSGRGVGLNVVKRYIEKINGSIDLETSPGKGCKFTIKLPLTLAIIPALMVGVSTEIFAIPLNAVEEAVRITTEDINTIESHKVIHLREQMIPLFELTDLLGLPGIDGENVNAETWRHVHSGRPFDPSTNSGHRRLRTPPVIKTRLSKSKAKTHEAVQEQFYGVIINDGVREIGLIVDFLLGENDIVIKSLNDDLVNVKGFSGASIQGDGQVSLVIDVVSLIDLAIEHVRNNYQLSMNNEQ